ncbi:hypothetical protein [Inhella proteolytica]|uniref:hypothetical protein n=1 Tax=Inhella proteolytica TaxID=2795029 RepID=UPI0018DCDCF2|nr:hypothetical protein [Inhella proteolytica]
MAAPPPKLATAAAFDPAGKLWLAGLDRAGQLRLRQGAGPLEEGQGLDVGEDRVAADGEATPRLLFGADGLVLLSYVRAGLKPYTGDVRLLRSLDGGAHFAPAITVHQDRQPITHRFQAMAFDGQGSLHLAWIDKRDLEAAQAAGRPYRGAAVYRNVSTDGGASFGPDIKLADHACECCRIALSPAADGRLAALWRHVFEPNERDHAFAWLDGSAPVRASLDRWAIDACPHHGPGLAAAADGGWHACWYGQRAGEPAVRLGRLDAQGRPTDHSNGSPRALPEAEHADLVSAGERVSLVWRQFDGRQTRLQALLSGDDGRRWQALELAQSSHPNDHPRLLRHGEQLWAVWRDTQGVRALEIHA